MRCDTPIRITTRDGNVIAVPCCRCPPCLNGRVDDWVFRMKQEERRSLSAYFVTLTYDNDHVPISPNGFMTLDRKAFQLFMKRFRKTQKYQLKYYMCGEYGSERGRPHYHAIIFNIDPADMLFAGEKNGFKTFVCRKMNKAWPFGGIEIGTVSGDSIAYCTKYVNKPTRIPMHKRDDRIKEFSNMSKGLGDNYLSSDRIQYHKADLERNYVTVDGGYKKRLPKYYRDRIYNDFEKAEQRQIIVKKIFEETEKLRSDFAKKYGTGFDFDEYMHNQKYNRLSFFKSSQSKRDGDF